MARCFVYNRFLHAKTLPEFEHVFEFNTIVKIKEEEHDPLDTEIGESVGTSASESVGICFNPHLELHSTIVPEQQPEESRVAPHPKLVIKFRDLWGDSSGSCDPPENRKKRRHKEITNETSNQCDIRGSKYYKTDLKVALKNSNVRSLSSKSKVSQSNRGKQNETLIALQKELNSDMKEMQDVWNLTHITHLENNSQILCECCGRSFPTARHLEAHIRYYTADGIFNCNLCNRKFSRSCQLKRHLKAMHTSQPNKRVYRYKCQICQDKFNKKTGLIAHVTHLHHQRALLKRKEGNWIRSKMKSLTSHGKKIKEVVSAKQVKFISELNPKNSVTPSTEKSFINPIDKSEQFIPASLRIEQQHEACLNNQIFNKFKDPEEVSIKVEYDEETNVEDEFDQRGLISRATKRLQEDIKQRNQLQSLNQVCLEISSENLQPQLRGNLIDHLGNTVGNWCVSESFDQPAKADYFPRSDSASVEVSSAMRKEKIKLGCPDSDSKNGALEFTIENHSIRKIIDNDAQLTIQNEKGRKDTGKKLLPLHIEFNGQVGKVSTPNMSEKIEAAKVNVIKNTGNRLSDIFHFEKTCESTVTSNEANVLFENIPLKNSSTFNAKDVVRLKNFKLKNVRVSLVKLENMLDFSKRTSNPVKADKFICIICKRGFSSKRGLKRHCAWKHGTQNSSNEVSELAETTKSTDKYSSEALLKNVKLEEQGNLGTTLTLVKHCHICNAAFRNTFSIVSHYIAVHINKGVLRCCLCYTEEKTSRKLRFHLYKHFNNRYGKNLPKSCVICAKELNIFSLSPRCVDCKEQLKSKRYLNKRRITRKVPVVEKKYVSLRKKWLPSFLRDTVVSGTSVVHNRSAKTDQKVSTEIVKNFKCLACNRVFLESGRLKDHLLTAHVDIEYCKRETYQKVESQIEGKNTGPKFKVGLKKTVRCKVTSLRNKSCVKKLCVRGRFKLFELNGKEEHRIQQRHFENGSKKCYKHKCNVCGLNCCCGVCLKMHKRRYSSDGNNVCNICGLTSAQKSLLAVHMKTAHDSKIIFNGKSKCEICTQGFYNKKFLRIHIAHFHNKKYLECKICGIKFDSFQKLNNHQQYYSDIVSCLCSTCGQIFECKYMLEYHNAQLHDHGELLAYKYSCDVCHCAFLDKLLLQAHIGHFHNVKNRQSQKNVFIENLGKLREQNLEDTENVFLYSNAITNDSTFQNGAIDETLKSVPPSSEYKCSLCRLSFTDPRAILNHEWEYSNDGEYVCDICNRKFMTDFHLKNHKIKHYQRNAIRKYECSVCKEDFLQENDLLMHGLHLHGPQFISGKNFEASKNHNPSKLNCQVTQNHEGIFVKSSLDNSHDSIGLLTNSKDFYDGKVLLFQKMANNRSPMELLRRNSNEDSYSCEFCQTNFSSASLLRDHTKKHAYRAYYTNLSRYLCLICKQKFRTNDILRAHVVYFHTSDQIQSISGKSECSSSSKPIKFEAMNISASPSLKHSILNPTSGFEGKCSSICQPNITLPEKREVFHPVNNTNMLQAQRVRRTYSTRKIINNINTNLGFSNTDEKKSSNSNGPNSKREHDTQLAPYTEFESSSDAVNLFTVKGQNAEDLRKYTCIICIQTFDSATHFAEHFVNVHVKDQVYICALCNKKFAFMSDLKHHINEHEEDPKHYMCCDKIFSQITDLMHHKLSHAKQDGKNQHNPDEDLPPSTQVGSLQKSSNEINVRDTVNMCKCEICDAAFSDFRTLLKHWDSCIIKNCLQCDFCGARFKGEEFLEVHKLSCTQNKQNSHNVQKRWSDTVRNNISGDKMISDNSLSVNPNPFKTQRRCYGPANKLSSQSRSLDVQQNINDKKEYHNNEKQETNTNVTMIKPRSGQVEVSSNQSIVSGTVLKKMLIENFTRRISLNMNSNAHTSLANKCNEQSSSKIPRETGGNQPSNDLSDEDFSYIGNLPNNFSQGKKQKELSPLLNTGQNPTSIKFAVHSSINIKDTRVESGQESCENDDEDTKSLNLKPQSSDTANSPVYYIRIQKSDNKSDNIRNALVIQSSNESQSHLKERHGNHRPLNLLQSPSNSKVSPAYYLRIPSTSDNSDENSNRTACNTKSRTINITNKQLSTLLRNSSTVSINSIHNSPAPEITNNSITNSDENIKSYDVTLKSRTNVNKYKKAPILPSLVRGTDSPRNNSALKKVSGSVVTNRNFRCSYCFAWFSEREELIEHLDAHKSERQCPACGIVFSNESALRLHLPEHECSICTKCSMVFFFKDSRAYHDGTQKYCSVCKSLLPVPSLKSHNLSTSSERQVIKCGVCMEAFDSMSKLSAHFRSVHLSFVCLICESRFSTKYTLRKHLHTHDKGHTSLMGKCKVCTNNFAEEVNLEDDTLSHETAEADE